MGGKNTAVLLTLASSMSKLTLASVAHCWCSKGAEMSHPLDSPVKTVLYIEINAQAVVGNRESRGMSNLPVHTLAIKSY